MEEATANCGDCVNRHLVSLVQPRPPPARDVYRVLDEIAKAAQIEFCAEEHFQSGGHSSEEGEDSCGSESGVSSVVFFFFFGFCF